MEDADKEVLLTRLARKQLCLITWSQLVELGFNIKYVRRRIAVGHWRRVFRGVYATDRVTLSAMRRHAAALLAAGPLSTLSHESAAQWLKIATPKVESTQLTIRRTDSGMRLDGVNIRWSPSLRETDILDRGPIKVTTRGRTMLDLSGVLEPRP